MQKAEENLRRTFTNTILDDLVKSLHQSYDKNLLLYDPNIGHDETTFGFMIAKSRIHFICEAAIRNPAIKILKRSPYVYFQVGDFFVSSYRVGDSLDEDIATLFPKNRNRAWKLAKENRTPFLPFAELDDFEGNQNEEVDDSDFRQIILADIGNSEEGLCGAFLGIPSKFDKGNRTITGWSSQVMIWERSTECQTNPIITQPHELSPTVNILPPDLSLKIIKKENEQK